MVVTNEAEEDDSPKSILDTLDIDLGLPKSEDEEIVVQDPFEIVDNSDDNQQADS